MEDVAKLRAKLFNVLEETLKEGIDVWTTPRDEVVSEGVFKLLHYHPLVEKTHPVPVLVVYAYINRPSVMDLNPEISVIRRLLEAGLNIYMIDWGYPSRTDKYLNIADYIDFIDYCVEKLRADENVPQLTLHGYCLGGTLSTIYSTLYPEKVKNLVLQATPINFNTSNTLAKWARSVDPGKIVEAYGCVPGEFMNTGFLGVDPVMLICGKYEGLFTHLEEEDFVTDFLRMERWIYDSPPIPGEVYKEYIREWYHENKIVKGEYTIEGKEIDLKKINMPTLILSAEKDHIAPPESNTVLLELISSDDKELMTIDRGHIGLSTSKKAHKEMWPKACAWIVERSSL